MIIEANALCVPWIYIAPHREWQITLTHRCYAFPTKKYLWKLWSIRISFLGSILINFSILNYFQPMCITIVKRSCHFDLCWNTIALLKLHITQHLKDPKLDVIQCLFKSFIYRFTKMNTVRERVSKAGNGW